MTIKTLKNKLTEHFGDGVLFVTIPKNPPVVCFPGSGHKLFNQWYNKRAANKKDERMRIVEAAAIICEDIRMTLYSIADYPDISGLTENAEVIVPNTLHEFLKGVVLSKKES